MEQLLSMLLHAAKMAQVHHWKCKSFARHIALGELYAALASQTDELAEMWMGKYGDQSEIPTGSWTFPQDDALAFVTALFDKLEEMKPTIPQDDWLVNKFEELQADVSRAKYKIENLK